MSQTEFKFDTGDRVYLNETAYSALPERNKIQLPNTYRNTIFTIAKRIQTNGVNKYFIPGYDWQGGTGWVIEDWLSKWCGQGPVRLTVTIDRDHGTEDEIMATTAEVRESIKKLDELVSLNIQYTGESAIELDKAAES